MGEIKKKIVFIVNPKSGIFSKDNIHEVISGRLSPEFFHYEVIFTEGPGHATQISREYAEKGSDIIVAVGGDGTVNEVARGLLGSQTSLGIIPGGSGNGLAHHLGIPFIRRKAIDVIVAGKTALIDTAMMNDHLFVSIAGIGFDGYVARKFAKESFRGFIAYLKVISEFFPRYRPKKYTLEFDGKVIKTRALLIAFANTDQFGFKTPIAPEAKVDDGLLDVAIVGKPTLAEIPILAGLLYWRKIDRSKYVTIYRTNEITVKTRRNRWANIDGEPVKPGKIIQIHVNPRSLRVILP